MIPFYSVDVEFSSTWTKCILWVFDSDGFWFPDPAKFSWMVNYWNLWWLVRKDQLSTVTQFNYCARKMVIESGCSCGAKTANDGSESLLDGRVEIGGSEGDLTRLSRRSVERLLWNKRVVARLRHARSAGVHRQISKPGRAVWVYHEDRPMLPLKFQ